jgi:hypothetical protein
MGLCHRYFHSKLDNLLSWIGISVDTTVQAPVHTDSLTVYETDLAVLTYTNSACPSNDITKEPEIRYPITKATSVTEQRVSHFLMGIALIGTMTGPLLIVLHLIPAAVTAGVFFIVGWGSIESNGIVKKIVFLLRERRFIPKHENLLQVKRRKVILYLICEIVPVAACVAISQTISAIGVFTQLKRLMLALILPNRFSHPDHRNDPLSCLDIAEMVQLRRTADS